MDVVQQGPQAGSTTMFPGADAWCLPVLGVGVVHDRPGRRCTMPPNDDPAAVAAWPLLLGGALTAASLLLLVLVLVPIAAVLCAALLLR